MNTMIEVEPQPRIDTLVRLPGGSEAAGPSTPGPPGSTASRRCPG
jgi:hypothetical protein